jgi:hypothetical protein
MNKNYIDLGNTIFSYTKIESAIRETIKSLTPAEIQDINQIEIRKQRLIYHLNGREIRYKINNKTFNEHLDQLSQKVVRVQRDIIGEQILKATQEDKDFSSLYLYSSGGGGHKSAKEAEMEIAFIKLMKTVNQTLQSNKELHIDIDINHQDLNEQAQAIAKDERLKDPAKLIQWCKQIGIVKDVDVLHDYVGKLGVWASTQWDEAQKAGDIEKQERLASKQWLSDFFFGPIVFMATLRSLIQLKPKKVISTQAMATPSILLAIKLYNKFFKPTDIEGVKLHLYMTDMPTEFAQHFFSSLNRISEAQGKDLLVLYAPAVQNRDQLLKLCGLQDHQVQELQFDQLPVRQDFVTAVKGYKSNPDCLQVEIKVSNQEELQMLGEVIKYQEGGIQHSSLTNIVLQDDQTFHYGMQPDDERYFIMLGSQPTKSDIKEYIQNYLTLARDHPEKNYHVFAFAGKFEKDKECIYKELATYIQKQSDWPTNLHILPLSYQDPKQLVSLEMTCDTITRSGGSTAMELLVLSNVDVGTGRHPRRFIHAHRVGKRDLEGSIPLWERGNYYFLREQIGAEIIDPESAINMISKKSRSLLEKVSNTIS